MKKYELIIKELIKRVEKSEGLADCLLLDISSWKEYFKQNHTHLSSKIEELKTECMLLSEAYEHFITNYYIPLFGEIDLYVPDADAECECSTIHFNFSQIKDEFPTLLPIGNINNGDYLFLNEKGEVITFLEIAKDSKPMDELTEVLDDEYGDGWDVAYLKYPDRNGDYRMYWILARSFDEFMNDCVFGDKYLEITDSDDAFYRCVKEIRNDLGI